MFNEFLLTDGSALMQHQIFQYTGFLTCQINCNAVYYCNTAFGIICNFAALQAYIPLNELPACQAADSGFQFCKVKCGCKALAEKCTSTSSANPDPGLLTPEKMASDILPWLAIIKSWVASMEEYALQQALSGVTYPGYKLVEGRSNRKITDDKAVIALLSKEGYDESEFMKPSVLCGIGDLEKLVGKKRLAVLCADFITKPQGKPTLATSDDKRPEYNSAAEDFKDINF